MIGLLPLVISMVKISDTRTHNFSKAYFYKNGLDTTKVIETKLSFVSKEELDYNEFNLTGEFFPSGQWPSQRCRTMVFSLYTNQGEYSCSFFDEGCSHWSEVKLAGSVISRERYDPSRLAQPIEDWNQFNLSYTEGFFSLNISGKELIKIQDIQSDLRFHGCGITFHGDPQFRDLSF